MRRRKEAHAELTAAVDRGTGAETARLIRIASAPLFQHALAQASPALLDEVRKAAALDRGLRRRTLIGLTKFLSRAATKTSPYSTFTAIARGTWTPVPAGARSASSEEIRCVTELDRMVFDQIMAALLADDALTADLRVRPNPSLTTTGTGHLFLGRRPDESLVFLPFSATVDAALELARQGCTVTELRARLATLPGGQVDTAANFSRRLLDLGVLELVSPVPDQSERPLADLIGFLEAASGHGHDHGQAPLLDQLRGLDRTVRRPVAPTDVDGVRDQQRTAVAELSELGRTLDLDWPAPEVLGKFAFHENAVVPDSGLTAATSEWGPLLTDLDLLRRWLGLHDRMLPVRIALSEYVRRRFGPQTPVGPVALHARLQQDLAAPADGDPEWLAPLRPFLQLSNPVPQEVLRQSPLPALRDLSALRRTSLETVLSAPRHGQVLRTDPVALTELVATWPSWVHTPRSVACYVQPYTAPDGLRAVVNTVSAGHGKGRGRWERLIGQAGGSDTGGPAHPADGDGPVLAEVAGTFGVSVNLRTPVAPYEIDYPFTTATRPQEQRVALSDLQVRHPGGSGPAQLWSAALDRQVVPVHMGMMADPLMPPAARLLFAAFGQSYLLHPSLTLLGQGGDPGPNGVRFLPRVEVGRVTIRRAEWHAPAERVPRRRPGQGSADHLIELVGWLRRNGVPDRCFVRLNPTGVDWAARVFGKSRKPLYLDFSSLSMVAVFENMLHDFSGSVCFEEALPDPVSPERYPDGDPRTHEFVVEVPEGRR